jgi:hypothetical protein
MQWNFQDGKARNEFIIKSREHCLELVVLGERAVHDQVERAHGSHGPEEVVEVAWLTSSVIHPGLSAITVSAATMA